MLTTIGQGKTFKKLPLTMLSSLAYCTVVFLTLVMSFVFAQVMGFSATAASLVVLIGLLVGIFGGLILNFALGPLQLKNDLEPLPLPQGPHRDLIESCFKRANLRSPKLWIIESEKCGHNVIVSGFRFGRGWFQPAVFITHSVLESCSTEEISGIIFHEIGHLRQNHLLKRATMAGGSFVGSALFMSLFCVILAQLISPQALRFTWVLNLIAPVLMTFASLRKQGLTHELDADAVAVIQFQSSASLLIETLNKLDSMNSQTKNNWTKIRVAALQKLSATPIEQKAA